MNRVVIPSLGGGTSLSLISVLYILSSFLLVFGAATLYSGNRQSPKHRTFAILFVLMACWQQSALLITLLPPEQATYFFVYGLIPLLLASFALLLHGVYLITDVYERKHAILYKLLLVPPIINVLLFPVDGWLYSGEMIVYSDQQPLPGPGGFINFSLMFIYMVTMVSLLIPYVKRKHRPSQIWMTGMALFILWVLLIVLFGELTGSWTSFSLVPFGIDFWAAAVYITINKYDAFPSYEKRYKLLFEKAPIGIMITDSEAIIREASPRAAQHVGFTLNQLIGMSLFGHLDGPERERQLSEYKRHFEQRKPMQHRESSFRNANGLDMVISISSDFIEMEGQAYQLLMAEDVSESRHREKQIHQLAYFDQLTGLHNRASFNIVFEEWRVNKPSFALMIMDLNGFKQINDHHGHLAGDRALKHFAERLQSSISTSDFVARLSGDEFVIMLDDVRNVEPVILSIRSGLQEPFEIAAGSRLTLSTSIGAGLYPGDGSCLDDLFKEADDRMYAEKRNGMAAV
jgi:diguanylate cyclase (GGDEF)-like protein/PAS domain S-box-containing protein